MAGGAAIGGTLKPGHPSGRTQMIAWAVLGSRNKDKTSTALAKRASTGP